MTYFRIKRNEWKKTNLKPLKKERTVNLYDDNLEFIGKGIY